METWEKAFALLEEARLKRQRPAKRTVHLFAGFVCCECGTKMYVSSDTPKYLCQECRNKIPIVDLEAIFYEQLRGYFLSGEEVAGYLGKADAALKESEELVVTLKAERDATQKKIDRLYDDYGAERLTGDQFNRLFQPLDTRIKQLDEELPRVEARVTVLKVDHLSSDRILTESKDLYDRWPLLNRDEKRQVVEDVTVKIVVGKGEVAIKLAFFPGYEDLANEQKTVGRCAPPFPLGGRVEGRHRARRAGGARGSRGGAGRTPRPVASAGARQVEAGGLPRAIRAGGSREKPAWLPQTER